MVSGRGQCASGVGRTDGSLVGPGSGAGGDGRLRFDVNVSPQGYVWWYLDAFSDDGTNGLTLIAFVGSVFSPYYAWSGRHDPHNHCALNVALYRPRDSRWAMTERGRGDVSLWPDRFEIGPSMIRLERDTLVIDVNERSAPTFRRMQGQIRVSIPQFTGCAFKLDAQDKHRWRPLSPSVEVEVAFQKPNVSWSGRGYLDSNDGDEPLEEGFSIWDWSRIELAEGRTAILYNTSPRGEEARRMALVFNRDGTVEDTDPPETGALPSTSIWRIARPSGSTDSRVIKTLEDTPFYSRSMIEAEFGGRRQRAMHESFDGDRLRQGWVKALLPFRMPRLAR
ncbi:MAG: hypothetical protein AAFQ85_05885 [Pseudomonadota bacterium]